MPDEGSSRNLLDGDIMFPRLYTTQSDYASHALPTSSPATPSAARSESSSSERLATILRHSHLSLRCNQLVRIENMTVHDGILHRFPEPGQVVLTPEIHRGYCGHEGAPPPSEGFEYYCLLAKGFHALTPRCFS